ncbi:hypothetical protein [Alishewanella longhuensis]
MFFMEGKKRGCSQYLASLQIVPVCLSYEFDPCDKDKVNELWHKQQHGNYQNGELSTLIPLSKVLLALKAGRMWLLGSP